MNLTLNTVHFWRKLIFERNAIELLLSLFQMDSYRESDTAAPSVESNLNVGRWKEKFVAAIIKGQKVARSWRRGFAVTEWI